MIEPIYNTPEARANVDAVIAAGPFAADDASLSNFVVPEWYLDAKFGIFIHWGVYSVPAFGNEWYPRNMYIEAKPEFAHHRATYGPQLAFGYKDFVDQFKGEKFDANAWVSLFKEAGAKYVIPVAEHHDGFTMYDCSFDDWNSVKRGPRRDVIGELAQATRAANLVFGLSSHRAEHWWFFAGGKKFDSDVEDPANASLYGPAVDREQAEKFGQQPDEAFSDDWLFRTCELVDQYRPAIVWFDWWIDQPGYALKRKQFGAFYYNRAATWPADERGVAVNFKHGAFPKEAGVFDIERGGEPGIRSYFWQTDTSVATNTWGFTNAMKYRSSTSLIHDLIDIVSKNGCLLLNVGPRADGTIPDEQQAILRDIGAWLKVNGEAIYATRPWKSFGQGVNHSGGQFTDTKRNEYSASDLRFTQSKDGKAIYIISLGHSHAPITVRAMHVVARSDAASVEQLNASIAPDFSVNDAREVVITPSPATNAAIAAHATVFKLTGFSLVAAEALIAAPSPEVVTT